VNNKIRTFQKLKTFGKFLSIKKKILIKYQKMQTYSSIQELEIDVQTNYIATQDSGAILSGNTFQMGDCQAFYTMIDENLQQQIAQLDAMFPQSTWEFAKFEGNPIMQAGVKVATGETALTTYFPMGTTFGITVFDEITHTQIMMFEHNQIQNKYLFLMMLPNLVYVVNGSKV
jgi:hypothetical protein